MRISYSIDAAGATQVARARCKQSAGFVAIVAAVLLFAAASIAHGATYYVATDGNDSAAGTQAAPWRTIQRAANATNGGDIVLVNTGVYREKVTFTRSGAAGKYIVVKNVPGNFPVIDGAGVAIGQWDALVGFNNVGYIQLQGFEIRNSSAYNVWVGGESHHLLLDGLDIHSGDISGIWLDGPKKRPAMSVISGNKIHNHNQGGITVWTAFGGYYRIENNQVWGNLGQGNYDGIQVGGHHGGSHHVIVKNNTVYDNGSVDIGEDNIDLGGHGVNHHYLVEGNLTYGGTGSFKVHSGQLKSGWYETGVSSYHIARFNQLVGKAFVSYQFPNPIAMYNNTLINCGQCVMFYGEDSSPNQNLGDATYKGGDSGRMVWKNNLFYQDVASDDYALLQAGPGGATIDLTYRSVRFENNMYKFSSGQALIWKDIFGPPIDGATFAKYRASNAPNLPDLGSLLTTASWSQMFVGLKDYHLASGSPAIAKGISLTKATNAGVSSTRLVVDRASYFQDGYCLQGECLNTADSIVVGNNAPVRIVAIDDLANTITIATPLTWSIGAAVSLPFKGSAADIGAFAYTTGPRLPAPTNLRVLSIQ